MRRRRRAYQEARFGALTSMNVDCPTAVFNVALIDRRARLPVAPGAASEHGWGRIADHRYLPPSVRELPRRLSGVTDESTW
jgi:hypothetical protein